MELRNRTNGIVVTETQFRAEHRNTSFPPTLTPELIDSFGYDPVFEGPQPTLIPPYQHARRDGVIQIDGKWYTHYVAAEPDADDKARMDADQADRIRTERNRLLSESDWTQLADSPLDADAKLAWQLYRETLRMVPQQSGFPWNVDWPPVPGSN